jgi:hypothetical protein
MSIRRNTQEIDSAKALMGKNVMEEMHSLDCVLTWQPGARKPELNLEEPTAFQTEVFEALGYVIEDGWVLQK